MASNALGRHGDPYPVGDPRHARSFAENIADLRAATLAQVYRTVLAARDALGDLPVTVRRLMGRLERGDALFEVRHQSGGSLERHLLHASNRLAFALIIAAMVIGSAIVISADAGPELGGLPILGIAGFVVAGALGFAWAVLALRSGKL